MNIRGASTGTSQERVSRNAVPQFPGPLVSSRPAFSSRPMPLGAICSKNATLGPLTTRTASKLENRLFTHCLTAALAVLLTAGSAYAKRADKISPDPGSAESAQEYIVSFKEAPSEKHHAKIKRKGGTLKQELKLIKAGVYNLTEEAISELSEDNDVEYIAPNRIVKLTADPAALDYFYETANANIARSYGFTGKNIGVAVVDSGVFDHNDLKGTTAVQDVDRSTYGW